MKANAPIHHCDTCTDCVPTEKEEHRGSRAHVDEDPVREAPREPIDRMFQEAAAAGFKPVTEDQAEAMRQKLRGVSAVIHGGRR